MATSLVRSLTEVRSAVIAEDTPLVDLLPADHPVAWVRNGEGLVAWGETARLEVAGSDRFAIAQQWWDKVCADVSVHDDVEVPGSGPVAFGSFAFADDPGHSVLVVPQVVLGRRDGVTWVTTFGDAADLKRQSTPTPPRGVRYAEGSRPVTTWGEAVAEAVARITRGDLGKVVLAYDLVATADDDIDVRYLLQHLADRYADCWVFSVDGLVGATPELLVRRDRDIVESRVLAGTVGRGADAAADERRAAALLASHKDREEHEYAVASAVAALEPHCRRLDRLGGPDVLALSNVLHLSTDVAGLLANGESALELAAALHPTAAVGGTPTPAALDLIGELEGLDRGRYAGPVGWVDADGDGEWGIALRCAEINGRTARLFAGCGIVAESDPESEIAEAQTKFVPMRDALQGL